jgi:hypothetical protein
MAAQGQGAMTFIYYIALSYVAASLIASAVHHVTRLAGFSDIVRYHRIISPSFAMPLAIFVTVFELVVGSTALAALFIAEVSAQTPLLFSVCTATGLAFALYVRQLLRSPEGITSCGCSSFASPLTIASIIPALTLVLMSLLGLVTNTFGFGNALNPRFLMVQPLLWGVTLSLIINLLPASMPRPAT